MLVAIINFVPPTLPAREAFNYMPKGIKGFQKGNKIGLGNKNALGIKGNKHYNWKGKNAGKSSMHKWLVSNYRNPKICEDCGKIGIKVNGRWNIQWSNFDHSYKREKKDYKGRCSNCHKHYDNKFLKEKICKMCGKKFRPTVISKLYCGSRQEKTGCSYFLKLLQTRNWRKAHLKKEVCYG